MTTFTDPVKLSTGLLSDESPVLDTLADSKRQPTKAKQAKR